MSAEIYWNQKNVPELITEGIQEYKEMTGSKDMSDIFEITKDDKKNDIIRFPYESLYLSDVIHYFKEVRMNPDNNYNLYQAQCMISFLKNLKKFEGQNKEEIIDNLNKNYVGECYLLKEPEPEVER